MALLFSAVKVTAGDDETELLVGGIPREYDDLEGWTFFDNFVEELDEETEVSVHAEAYLYGEGETYRATRRRLLTSCGVLRCKRTSCQTAATISRMWTLPFHGRRKNYLDWRCIEL